MDKINFLTESAVKPKHVITSGRIFLNSSNSSQSVKKKETELKKYRKRGQRGGKRHSKMVDDDPSGSIPPFSPTLSKTILKNDDNVQHWRKVVDICTEEISTFTFTITRVKNTTSGRFIRTRNSKHKYINIKSFLLPGTVSTYVSKSVTSDVNEFEEQVRKVPTNKGPTPAKTELRKFPKRKERTRRQKGSISKESDEIPFPSYMSSEDVATGLENGSLYRGFVRINPKNFKEAYVSNEDTSQADFYLTSIIDRNRALEGDEVILQVKAESEWIDGKKTAKVVSIKQMVHSRISVGSLKPSDKKNSDFALFYPRDKRYPILRIPQTCWPNSFKEKPDLFGSVLFVAKILSWTVSSYGSGILIENLGLSGDLKVETVSILREFGLDVTPFTEDIKEYLPQSQEIPEREFEYREDIRRDCVFTIDPETARDLDDALSVKVLPNGNFEVGVHISDASFYLVEGTELDQAVSKKATTIYLVNNVYHMLPVDLCLFCSLLPGEDKLSFSVFWEITPDSEILSKRFTRSIMNSCVKLAYEHAQMVIENPDEEFTIEDFPLIHNNFHPTDIVYSIKNLQKIAKKLRQKRVENGALKIEQTKLTFDLHPLTGDPISFQKYESKEAHWLIEEFMLLANISVAERIYQFFPQLAFLRCHDPPKQTMLVELQTNLATCGIYIDVSSSGGISNSLKKYITDDYSGLCRAAVLNHLTAKAMTRARYFCAATTESELDFKHYALSIPIYTHFTSPIRRYADIMVHRLLAASLDYQEPPQWDETYVSAIALNCNAQKYNAKRAGEASIELYLSHYITKHQPFVQDCVVVDVKERSFDAIVLKTGSIVRIYSNNCESGTLWETESIPTDQKESQPTGKKLRKLTIKFPRTKQCPESSLIVKIFTLVRIKLERKNSYKLEGSLLRPRPSQVYNRTK